MPEKMKRFCFENDEDGHWYLIPIRDKELFSRLLYNDDDETEFVDAFDDCRLSMHVSNYSFTDIKESD